MSTPPVSIAGARVQQSDPLNWEALMQHLAKRSLALTIAAGGLLAVGASCAVADSTAAGNANGSPGLLSGNTVQVPVNVPVNVCGITVNVVALLDPAADNNCVDHGSGAVVAPPVRTSAPPRVTPPRATPPRVTPPRRAPQPAPQVAPPADTTTPPAPSDVAMTPTATTLAKTGAGDTAGYAAVGGTLIAGGALARRFAGRHARSSA